MPMATAQWSGSSAVVPNAVWRNGTCTTMICSTTPNPMAYHSHRLLVMWWNALWVSERELRALKSWASTSVVNPTVRAVSKLSEPAIRPPG